LAIVPCGEKAMTKTATKKATYLVEFYRKNPQTGEAGWDIHFAWILGADDRADAKRQAATLPHFDCVITCERADLAPLACDSKKIHIVR
jgi:hypothetical protein